MAGEETPSRDPLEKKLRQLEEEVKSLREPLEKTLLDVREILGTLENPFTYVSALLGSNIPELKAQQNKKPDVEQHKEEEAHQQIEPLKQHHYERPAPIQRRTEGRSLGRFLNIMAATNLMIGLVGREQVLNIVNMMAWKGLLPKDIADDVKEALELSARSDFGIQYESLAPKSYGLGNVLVVLYLLSKVAHEEDDPLLLLLLTAFDRLHGLSGQSNIHGKSGGF